MSINAIITEKSNGNAETIIFADKTLTLTEVNEKKMVYDCNDDTEIILPAYVITDRLKHFFVKTTKKEIDDNIKSALKENNEERKKMYASVCREVLKYTSAQLGKHCENNTNEWRDWCNDLLLFFVYNCVVFGKAIPHTVFKK